MSSVLAQSALICHPKTDCKALAALGAQIRLTDDHGWEIEFVAMGHPGDLRFPAPAEPVQTDGLWRATCFELFVRLDEDAYVEFNFSPSSAWAAYHLDHYRTGRRPLDIPAPQIALNMGRERMTFTARLQEDALPWDRAGPIGISAVIEEADGTLSFWALAHARGKPDFHHRDCFALTLPPVERT